MQQAQESPLAYFSKDAATNDVVAALRRDGAAIIRDQVDHDVVDAVMRELRPHFNAQGRSSESEFNGYSTLRISCVLAHSKSSAALIAHPRVLEVADAILLDHCVNYQLGSITGIEILPGEKDQILHRDDAIYPFSLPGSELQISAMWALNDFTIENGATRVALGTRTKFEPFLHRDDEICQAVMSKGSVLFYLGRTLHGGGANRSDGARTGLINTYSLGWLRPEINHVLTLPEDVVHSYPEPIPRLLGYQSHGEHLGLYPGDPDGVWGDDVLD